MSASSVPASLLVGDVARVRVSRGSAGARGLVVCSAERPGVPERQIPRRPLWKSRGMKVAVLAVRTGGEGLIGGRGRAARASTAICRPPGADGPLAAADSEGTG